MGKGFQKRKKQAQMMQEQLSKMQEQMNSVEEIGSAGAGLVTVTMSGDYQVKRVVIKRECIDPEDSEALEDLVKAAVNDALEKVNKHSQMPTGAGSPAGMPDLSQFFG